MPNITTRGTAVERRPLKPLPSSSIDVAVEKHAEALRGELRPTSAIEQSAITEYIEVECQRLRLRLMRDQIERTYALGHIWSLLSNAMIRERAQAGLDATDVDQQAQAVVRQWLDGDPAAHKSLIRHGIDIDEAISMSMATHLPRITEFEHERERLAKRARLLLDDIERTRLFRRSHKLTEIQEAEVIE